MKNCRFAVLMITLALALPLSYGGCGSRSGEGSGIRIFPPMPYRADKDTTGIIERYAASQNGTNIIKLSGAIVAGAKVIDFKISPDGSLVAYLADQDTNETFELYASEPNGYTNVNISGMLTPGGDVFSFEGFLNKRP